MWLYDHGSQIAVNRRVIGVITQYQSGVVFCVLTFYLFVKFRHLFSIYVL